MSQPHVGDTEFLAYMRSHKLAVVSTLGADGSPQSALVGVATTDDFQIIFDTVSTSRKHGNLLRDVRIAVTFSGPSEQTLQYEGMAISVSVTDPCDEVYREQYYLALHRDEPQRTGLQHEADDRDLRRRTADQGDRRLILPPRAHRNLGDGKHRRVSTRPRPTPD